MGGEERQRLAAVDAESGELLDWNPHVEGASVNALEMAAGTLFAAGNFNGVSGELRSNLAAFDTTNGSLLPINPGPPDIIRALARNDQHLYVAVGENVLKYDHVTMIQQSWSPDFSPAPTQSLPQIHALAYSDDVLYVGGGFGSVAGETRYNLAAFDADGDLIDWSPASPPVGTMALADGVVYIGGPDYAVAMDSTTGDTLPWEPEVNGRVRALIAQDGVTYLGGEFTEVDGTTSLRLFAVDSVTGDTVW